MIGPDLKIVAKYFTDSLGQVLRTMAGFDISHVECNLDNPKCIEPDIMGAMILHGNKDAMITLGMERETAVMIIAYMTGILPEELEEQDLADGLAELTNIMAGEVKARLSGTPQKFILTTPFAIWGRNIKLDYRQNIPDVCRCVMAGDMEIIFRIAYL